MSKLILVGKLIADRSFPNGVIPDLMLKVWRSVSGLSIDDLKDHMCLLHFQSSLDKDFILQNAPWNFKGHLLILKEWLPDIGIDEIDMSKAHFWVQLHGLPPAITSLANIKLIGQHLGTLLEIEPLPFGLACKKFVRIKVELAVDSPLKTGFLIPRLNKSPALVTFRYERLSDFCYHCGRLIPVIFQTILWNLVMDLIYVLIPEMSLLPLSHPAYLAPTLTT